MIVDATTQGNADVRAGPLPPVNAAGGWTVHVYVDHCIVELIVNNVTALVVYAAPGITSAKIDLFGVPAGKGSEASNSGKTWASAAGAVASSDATNCSAGDGVYCSWTRSAACIVCFANASAGSVLCVDCCCSSAVKAAWISAGDW